MDMTIMDSRGRHVAQAMFSELEKIARWGPQFDDLAKVPLQALEALPRHARTQERAAKKQHSWFNGFWTAKGKARNQAIKDRKLAERASSSELKRREKALSRTTTYGDDPGEREKAQASLSALKRSRSRAKDPSDASWDQVQESLGGKEAPLAGEGSNLGRTAKLVGGGLVAAGGTAFAGKTYLEHKRKKRQQLGYQ
jgi:hypothetical protein